jgi:hypothetical protein
MKSIGWKNTAELVGLASIVASLLLVAFELRQNTAISTAQAVFDVNTVLDDSYRRRAENPQLDALIENGHNNPSSLSEREQSQFDSWLHADMNITEAVWFYYSNGILEAGDMDGFMTSICGRITTQGGRAYWKRRAARFARGFRDQVDKWCYEQP